MRKIFCFLLLASCLITANSAVVQEVKLRNKGDTCNSSNEGAMYYDNADDTFYLCRTAASGWEAFEDLAPASGGASLPPGSIDWSNCEYKSSCGELTYGGGANTTLSCSSGKVLVDHSCYAATEATTRGGCNLSGVNSLYVDSYETSGGSYGEICGSIKCCTLVTG